MLHHPPFAEDSFRDSVPRALQDRHPPEVRHGPRTSVTAHSLLMAALDLLRMSVMLTDHDAQLLYANRQGRHLLSEQRGLRVSMGRLSAANPKCALRLREAIHLCAQAKYCEQLPLGIAVPIPQADSPSLAAWVHPAERMRTGDQKLQVAIFVRSVADLFSGEVFAAAFGATPAEVRVLKLLIDGLSIQDISAALDLTRNTVRTHVKSLFAKTGTRRQVELVGLAATAIAPASAQEPNGI